MSVHIGIGFKSRMKNTASKKKTCLGFLLIVFLAYVVCYLLSQTVFHEVYLFEWTAAHYYLCLWVASVTFCFLEMYRAALITTAGNWTGILIGQVLGDFIIKINATNHAGYVYRKNMAAQGTLRSFDLATRFPTFVYYRNAC